MGKLFELIAVPFGYVMEFSYKLTHNYLLAIFLFTLIMEIILSPIAIKQQKNQIRQARLAPKVAAIRKKYAGRNDQATQQKMQQETMDMYQQENFNPMSGCLPLLLQLPIIYALYFVIQQPLRYLCHVDHVIDIPALVDHFASELTGVSPTAQQFKIINLIKGNVNEYKSIAPTLAGKEMPNLSVFGLDFSRVPSIEFKPFDWLMLIPIATFFIMVLSTKIMQHYSYKDPMTADQQNSLSMKLMTWSMPLLSVYIEFKLPAAIGVYWVSRSIIQTIEKIVIAKVMPLPAITEEEYLEAEREANMSNKQKKKAAAAAGNGDRPFVRSLHHIDDEEYIARHAEELKAYEEEHAARENYRPRFGLGKTTDSKDAPAPIKNDEKASYEEKSSDETK